jgi:hypothetical protein
VLGPETRSRLSDAAPDAWVPEPHRLGDVALRGLRTGGALEGCDREVQQRGDEIAASLNARGPAADFFD